jgi:hypothetical protein
MGNFLLSVMSAIALAILTSVGGWLWSVFVASQPLDIRLDWIESQIGFTGADFNALSKLAPDIDKAFGNAPIIEALTHLRFRSDPSIYILDIVNTSRDRQKNVEIRVEGSALAVVENTRVGITSGGVSDLRNSHKLSVGDMDPGDTARVFVLGEHLYTTEINEKISVLVAGTLLQLTPTHARDSLIGSFIERNGFWAELLIFELIGFGALSVALMALAAASLKSHALRLKLLTKWEAKDLARFIVYAQQHRPELFKAS